MKKKILITVFSILFSFALYAQQNNENFYYYQGEKIFLQQSANRLFVKFSQNANREQIYTLINNHSLQLTSNMNIDDNYLDFAIFETKNENDIVSFATVESFKANPAIISATPLFMYNDVLQGLTDEFAVKLKSTVSYNQLQELVEKNNCLIKEENRLVENQFMISVHKNAKLNAMEMSRLFFHTGFFEFSEPNFILFNASHFNNTGTYFDAQ
ncbi:MAG: hypothetical protein FWC34_07670 [Bacteroidetes bacterium]|nr:hypothetical protein [Bacteroidota bacterium]MCL2302530.1 hypothetical protein [Lentimicrobiaceae bacterium]